MISYKHKKYVDLKFTLCILLIISIMGNIYYFITTKNYRYQSEKHAYTAITDIRDKNEINYNILNKGIQDEFISNVDLLKLYKNYETIDSDFVVLTEQYADYIKGAVPFFHKKIDKPKALDKLEYDSITEYILSNLNEEMKTDKSGLTLGSDETYYAEVLFKMSDELKSYFENFDNANFQNLDPEKKEKTIITKHYWIDMISGICDVNEKYGDVQWKLKNDKEQIAND